MTESSIKSEDKRVVWVIVALIVAYIATLVAGYPQYATKLASSSHDEHAAELHAGAEQAEAESSPKAPPLWTVAPFVLLLGAIAVFPLLRLTEHWWESNLHRLYVAAGLALIALAYYAFLHRAPVDVHWPAHNIEPVADSAYQPGFVKAVLFNAILSEYVPFIVLLFSLYTIAGGIRIAGDLRADSLTNAAIMGTGGVLASLIGTTGAAMLLVRLLLETNSERKHVAHTVVFFIFIVCNCGGCLLPIGDPPLFLGYLQGVAFTWTLGLWPSWLLVNGLLIFVYVLMDHFYY